MTLWQDHPILLGCLTMGAYALNRWVLGLAGIPDSWASGLALSYMLSFTVADVGRDVVRALKDKKGEED